MKARPRHILWNVRAVSLNTFNRLYMANQKDSIIRFMCRKNDNSIQSIHISANRDPEPRAYSKHMILYHAWHTSLWLRTRCMPLQINRSTYKSLSHLRVRMCVIRCVATKIHKFYNSPLTTHKYHQHL